MNVFGKSTQINTDSKRIFAYFRYSQLAGFVSALLTRNLSASEDETSNFTPSYCQHRYPSPSRSVSIRNRPAYPFLTAAYELAEACLRPRHRIAILPAADKSAEYRNSQKGTYQCSRKHGLLHPSPASRLQVALTQMANALSSAPAQASSLLMFSAPTARALHLLVLPQAHSATTSAFAANTLTSPQGASTKSDRRWGFSPAAVLRSRDHAHV